MWFLRIGHVCFSRTHEPEEYIAMISSHWDSACGFIADWRRPALLLTKRVLSRRRRSNYLAMRIPGCFSFALFISLSISRFAVSLTGNYSQTHFGRAAAEDAHGMEFSLCRRANAPQKPSGKKNVHGRDLIWKWATSRWNFSLNFKQGYRESNFQQMAGNKSEKRELREFQIRLWCWREITLAEGVCALGAQPIKDNRYAKRQANVFHAL